MQSQASPQHSVTAGGVPILQPKPNPPNGTKKKGEDAPITYGPVTPEGAKAFFKGISQKAIQELETNLPPKGVVLPPAPVPQIVPSEVTTEYQRRAEAMMSQLYKMDDVELTTKVQEAKQHPLFVAYEIDMVQPEHDDTPVLIDFGGSPIDDLCSFYMWLESQGCDKDQQKQAWEATSNGPATTHAPAVETTTAVSEAPIGDTFVDELSQQMDLMTLDASTHKPHEHTAESSAVEIVETPLPPILPDNQLGDPSLTKSPSPSPPPVVTTPVRPSGTPASPEAGTDMFRPITSEGMRAFYALMKRKSTDEFSSAQKSPMQSSSPQPLSPPAAEPVVPAAPATLGTSEAPAPTFTPATPAPTPTVPTTPAPTFTPAPTVATFTPPAPVKQTFTAAAPAPTPTVPTFPAVPAFTPAAPTPTSAAATPTPPATPTPSATETSPTTEPSADDIKEARATYMRFYRSVRSAKAPKEVTKNLGIQNLIDFYPSLWLCLIANLNNQRPTIYIIFKKYIYIYIESVLTYKINLGKKFCM